MGGLKTREILCHVVTFYWSHMHQGSALACFQKKYTMEYWDDTVFARKNTRFLYSWALFLVAKRHTSFQTLFSIFSSTYNITKQPNLTISEFTVPAISPWSVFFILCNMYAYNRWVLHWPIASENCVLSFYLCALLWTELCCAQTYYMYWPTASYYWPVGFDCC